MLTFTFKNCQIDSINIYRKNIITINSDNTNTISNLIYKESLQTNQRNTLCLNGDFRNCPILLESPCEVMASDNFLANTITINDTSDMETMQLLQGTFILTGNFNGLSNNITILSAAKLTLTEGSIVNPNSKINISTINPSLDNIIVLKGKFNIPVIISNSNTVVIDATINSLLITTTQPINLDLTENTVITIPATLDSNVVVSGPLIIIETYIANYMYITIGSVQTTVDISNGIGLTTLPAPPTNGYYTITANLIISESASSQIGDIKTFQVNK